MPQSESIVRAIEAGSDILLLPFDELNAIDDIKKAKDLNNKNIEGIIVGKAIYDGDIELDELVKEIDA